MTEESADATLESVAALARVSRQTVSNVLHHPARVAAPTRERVLAAIAESGYQPSLPARQLATRRAHAVAVRAERQQDGISGLVLDAFYHGLAEAGYGRGLRVVLYPQHADAHAELAHVDELVRSRAADAVVLTATGSNDERAQHLSRAGVTFCAFGRPWDNSTPNHDWVDVDGADGTAQAVRHLLDRGYRRIAWLGWPGDGTYPSTGTDRRRGWLEELERSGTPGPRIEEHTENNTAAAEATVFRMLDAEDRPDAVVCASDTLALGAYRAGQVSRAGRPALGIVGFDATPVASALGIPSVAQPISEAAHLCIEMLSDRFADPEHPGRSVLLSPTLRVPP